MKLIKPSFQIINQKPELEGIYKQIEAAGRTCYKSEDKITEDSSKGFVDRMIKSGHGAMLEHGTVYLFIPLHCDKTDYYITEKYHSNPYSRVKIRNDHYYLDLNGYYITTNFRVLIENGWMEHLKFICEPTEHHEKRVTVKFICDRGVSHEFVRHRVFSFAQESTRYCNYSKDKFDNQLTFVIPSWLDIEPSTFDHYPDFDLYMGFDSEIDFINDCLIIEGSYLRKLKQGWSPQQARAILPNALKTELVMTGFVNDWKHFFELRDAVSAHPQAQELAHPLHEAFIQRGLINLQD